MARDAAHARVDHNLTLHPPRDRAITDRMEMIRALAKTLAHEIVDLVPEGREQSMALTAVEDACQYAISGLARNQDAIPATTS